MTAAGDAKAENKLGQSGGPAPSSQGQADGVSDNGLEFGLARKIERHLTPFTVLARERHFQRAAQQLGVTQSALTRRIQLLEHEVGFKLFERSPRGVRLTRAGESLHKDAEKILQELAGALVRARNISNGSEGSLRLGINPSSADNPIISRTLKILRNTHGQIDVLVNLMYSEEQIRALQSDLIDIAVVYQFRKTEWADYVLVSEDELVLILPVAHALAAKPVLEIDDLRQIPMVGTRRSMSPTLVDGIISACHQAGFSPNIAVEVHSVESAISIVSLELGFGLVMAHQVVNLPPTVTAKPVKGLNLHMPLYLAWKRDMAKPAIEHVKIALAAAQDQILGGQTRMDG